MNVTGPDKWAKDFPIADGPRQSPINIVPMEAQYDPSLKGLKLKYDQSNANGILNNGHSFQVDFVDDTDSSSKGHKWYHFMRYFILSEPKQPVTVALGVISM